MEILAILHALDYTIRGRTVRLREIQRHQLAVLYECMRVGMKSVVAAL